MHAASTVYASRIQRFRLPRVCVAVVGEDPSNIMDRAESLVRDNPFMEFRLDYLSDPVAGLPKLKHFLDLHPEATVIATCRRAVNGGKFRGSAAAQLGVLTKAAAAGFQLVDIEIQSAEILKAAELAGLKDKVGVILSVHDFKTTKRLEETFTDLKRYPADFYKVVSTATTLHDNVQMKKFLEAHSAQYEMVGLCMGEQGIISRVLGMRAGSIFTFAAATRGEETAPGQVTAGELRDTYRIEMVDAATQVYGVVGDPVGHSLSPIMMNTAFRRETVNAVYLGLHAKTLKDLMSCVHEIPIRGLSVTIPYKQEIVGALSNSDPLTKQIGACNTIVRAQDGKLYGFNTDVAGIVVPLEQRLTLSGAKILIVGAGGAARAAVYGLKNKGAEAFITNRTAAKGQALARQAKAKYLKRADVAKSSFDVIINATPLGMGSNKQSPLEEKELNTKFLFDLVYVPAETKLVKMAKAKNIQIIPGLEMFVQQGARQFEIWTGKPAPIAEMAFVVSKALERMAGPPEEPEEAAANGAARRNAKPEAEEPKPTKSASKKKAKPAPAKSAKKAAKKAKKR
ncbi:MAG TPA: shikimate dehydrogenase [Candidatus Methylomirabilis sp.]|nr:shikimate dehydrogenase [Candidatus Methylomirabilis sp.]